MKQRTLAEQIRYARKAKGLSQYALSLAVVVHERTVVAWEAGDHVPDEANMKMLRAELKPFLDDAETGPLASVSMDELLAEIDRRGFDVIISSKKDR